MEETLNTNARAILDVLCASEKHPTALEVYEEVRRVRPRIGLATVYRILHQLTGQGLSEELDVTHGQTPPRKLRSRRGVEGPAREHRPDLGETNERAACHTPVVEPDHVISGGGLLDLVDEVVGEALVVLGE